MFEVRFTVDGKETSIYTADKDTAIGLIDFISSVGVANISLHNRGELKLVDTTVPNPA